MLTVAEQKIVISTLAKRRAWLTNMLQDEGLDHVVREQHALQLKDLDSAMRKLGNMPITKTKTKAATNGKTPPAPPLTARKELSRKTVSILVAEDNKDSALLLIDMLKDQEFVNIDHASDGIEAFDFIKAKSGGYSLILCDWDMPGLNGLEVHAKAKASNTLHGAHFMMITAVSEANRIRTAVKQGVNDYIVKPIDEEVIKDKISKALKLPPAGEN